MAGMGRGPDDETRDKPSRRERILGVTTAVGAGGGAAVFAATGEVVWVAIGVALGIVIGAAIGYRDE